VRNASAQRQPPVEQVQHLELGRLGAQSVLGGGQNAEYTAVHLTVEHGDCLLVGLCYQGGDFIGSGQKLLPSNFLV
jgi:hypothetical protein